MTIYESEKLNEINQRVSLFNDENQFDDTNLVAKTINGLVEKQLEPHGTVRTAFLVIFWYQFVINFSNMNAASLLSLESVFSNCNSLESIDLSYFKAPKLNSLSYIFNGLNSLIFINLTFLKL